MRNDFERLETELGALAAATTYPATPALAARVRARIQTAARYEPQAPRPWALAAVALSALFVAGAALFGSIAPARDAVADIFDRINIFQTAEVPASLPTDVEGREVSLSESEALFGMPLALPAYPEDIQSSLTRVVFQEFPPADLRVIALFFEPADAPPFILFETNGRVGKGLGPGAQAQTVPDLFGGYWLEGLRIVQYYDTAGGFVQDSQRRTELNTLVWARGEFVFRLEGDLSQEEAVKIAQSLR